MATSYRLTKLFKSPFWRSLSARSRLTISIGFGAFVISAILCLLIYGVSEGTVSAETKLSLRAEAEANAKYLSAVQNNPHNVANISQVLKELPNQHENGYFLFENNSLIAVTGNPQLSNDISTLTLNQNFGTQKLPYYKFFNDVAIYVSSLPDKSYTFVQVLPANVLGTINNALIVTLILTVLILTLLCSLIANMAGQIIYAPIQKISKSSREFRSGNLDATLPKFSDPEFEELAENLSVMAQSIKSQLEREATFSADVSHELRTPLVSLGSAVYVLQRDRELLSKSGKEALDILQSEIDRFTNLVLDLLELSRNQSAGGESELNRVLVKQLVEETLKTLQSKPDIIDEDFSSECFIMVDKRRFERIVANLDLNATNYASGLKRLRIWKTRSLVRIAFEDNGPGVPNNEIAQIFNRFHRANKVYNTHKTGSGLGLTIVKEHMTFMGGSVYAENMTNGFRIVLQFPVA